MSSLTISHWLCATGGVLVGALVIKCIGFSSTRSSHVGMKQFFKLWLWFDGGVIVSAVSTVILKLTMASRVFSKFPKLTFICSLFGFVKCYPKLKPKEEGTVALLRRIFSCVVFWLMPSFYYCTFSSKTLETSLLYSIYLFTISFTLGIIIPLKGTIFPDLGFKITITGVIILVLSMLYCALIRTSNVALNTSIIIILEGVLLDDLQHLKLKYGNINEEDVDANFNVLKKSFAIFFETALIFGRLATLVDYVADGEMIKLEEKN